MSPNNIRTFIADSQHFYRQGVRACLASTHDIEICGEANVSPELTALIENATPNVLLLGIRSENDLDLARTLKQSLPSMGVIVLTSQHQDAELFLAIKSRAAAYLERHVTPDKLIETIRRAAASEHPINDLLLAHPNVAQRVLEQFQDLSWGKGVEAYVSPLTPRETQILRYMGQGYLNKQIAAELSLSEQTIKNHVTSILRKLDANARTQAVIFGIKRGLITLAEGKQT
jgi:DNA-binding NarL/FixJ family response regulator